LAALVEATAGFECDLLHKTEAQIAVSLGRMRWHSQSMIRKSVQRFSEKIMLNQRAKARW
jgi:hypothetical protein